MVGLITNVGIGASTIYIHARRLDDYDNLVKGVVIKSIL